jgi:hypothetical protein
MNRIVRENYPVSRLPKDLRVGLDPKAAVTVTIVEEEAKPLEKAMNSDEIWALRAPPFRTAQEIDDDLRRDRDAWDE